ncbi:septum formation initiator family protein [Leucobacter allii]|uniref:Septum formation initiator family protein n=1 Tax=Leucobacter allii TaxID=2932247 RepID=A0ABY4FPE1_9MICO|nr:septum formation initiator family protein [Leucobacter allii]UOQ58074.1 septum formation initiator family protein [Leucobacter allii]UOR02711.1 septum formation initiator family protein [Leucobacter allii]
MARGDGTVRRWREDLGAWASSLRFSGFTVLVVVLVLAGAVIVSPSLSTYVQQRREIAELRESVQEHQAAVNEIDAERAKWKDPVYIRSQARDRLFYVMPGETQLNVIDDIVLPVESDEETNPELSRMTSNWAAGLAASVLGAGTTDATPEELGAGTGGADPDPAAEPDPDAAAEESAE